MSIGDKMSFADWFKSGYSKEKERLELEFIRDKNEIRLESERKRKDIELGVKGKRAELEEQRLTYQIEEQKAKLEEAMGDYEEEETTDDTPEMKIFAPMIANMLNKNNAKAPAVDSNTSPPNTATTPELIHLTDEELEEIYKKTDKRYLETAKVMPDYLIKNFIKQKMPGVDEDTLNRACLRIKH